MIDWIELKETDGTGENGGVLVRVQSIDAMWQRKTYTTLLVSGQYFHVADTVEEIVKAAFGDERDD